MDENLLSRQLAVYGKETQAKLMTMNVLVVGLGAVGVEIAKNLILAGPNSVYLHDPTLVTLKDLGENYYLTPSSVGSPRDRSCVGSLETLNNYVRTVVWDVEGGITEDGLKSKNITALVVTNLSLGEASHLNTLCRGISPTVSFFYTSVYGLAGCAFSDLGPLHTISDPQGSALPSMLMEHAELKRREDGSEELLVTLTPGQQGLSPNPFDEPHLSLTFKSCEGGMAASLHSLPPLPVSSNESYSEREPIFSVKILPGHMGPWGDGHAGGGVVEAVNSPQVCVFGTMSDLIPRPLLKMNRSSGGDCVEEGEGAFHIYDYSKIGRGEQLHVAFCALEEYRKTHSGALPPLRDPQAAQVCIELAQKWVQAHKSAGTGSLGPLEVDADVIRRVASLASEIFSPLAAFFGGLVAQEVIKCTGKYEPIRQWFYFETFEVLGRGADPASEPSSRLPSTEFSPPPGLHPRYHSGCALLGRKHQELMMDQNIFLVGAGALGCEYLKTFALSGLGCGEKGSVTVTDGDSIEVSNLNRQFLFRPENVKAQKSTTASYAVKRMNPDIRVDALQTRVGLSSENVFNDSFWNKQTLCVSALDNMVARKYLDIQCTLYRVPYLNAGTEGMKSNVETTSPPPYATAPLFFVDSTDDEGKGIPLCTLKAFPYKPFVILPVLLLDLSSLFNIQPPPHPPFPPYTQRTLC